MIIIITTTITTTTTIIIILTTTTTPSSPDVWGLPELRVGDPGLGGHGPGSRDHGVQSVLGEVIILARSREEERGELVVW